MVKVGHVYISPGGNVDISSLPLGRKINLFINHMIRSSKIMSGTFGKYDLLAEENERLKIKEYVKAFTFQLERGPFSKEKEFIISYDKEDEELVMTALMNPLLVGYKREFIEQDRDLAEMGVFTKGFLRMWRLELSQN